MATKKPFPFRASPDSITYSGAGIALIQEMRKRGENARSSRRDVNEYVAKEEAKKEKK